jgi:histone deacetylase complex regulatory component SIN3
VIDRSSINPRISSENPNKNHHLSDREPETRSRKTVMQHCDAVGQRTNIFRRISLEITRPFDWRDAPSYLDAIKNQTSDQPYVYEKFIDIMKDFKSEQCAPTVNPFLDTGPLCTESTPPA